LQKVEDLRMHSTVVTLIPEITGWHKCNGGQPQSCNASGGNIGGGSARAITYFKIESE